MDKERKVYEVFLSRWQELTGPGWYETFRGGYHSRDEEIDILKAELMDARVRGNTFSDTAYKLRDEIERLHKKGEEVITTKKEKEE